MLLAVAAAEGARRLLSPAAHGRSSPLRSTCATTSAPRRSSADRATRGRSARSGWRGRRSTWPRSAALVAPAARGCCAGPARGRSPGGAAAGALLAAGSRCRRCRSARSRRRRAIAVGLDTQGWGGWGATWPRPRRSPAVFAAGGGAAVVGGHAPLAARAGGCLRRPARCGSAPCWPRWRRSCSTRCSTTSRRCPRARRAPTCSSSPRPPGSRWGRSTRSTPAAGRPPPTPT